MTSVETPSRSLAATYPPQNCASDDGGNDVESSLLAPASEGLDDGGDRSDSDSLLPTPKRPLSEEAAISDNNSNLSTPIRKSSSAEMNLENMEIFMQEGEDYSPLLRCSKPGTENISQRVSNNTSTNATNPPNRDRDQISSSKQNAQEKGNGQIIMNPDEDGKDDILNSEAALIPTDEHPLSPEIYSEFPQHLQNYPNIQPIPPTSEAATSTISHRRRVSRRSRSSEEHADLVPTSNSSNSSTVGGTPGSASNSATTNSNHSVRNSLDTGMGALRRWIRNRNPQRNTSTADSTATASQPSNNTHSLGDEDLFALSLIGEDPRTRTLNNTHGDIDIFPPFSTSRLNASDRNFPPIVWEEADELDLGSQEMGRRRTFSEPNGNRIRDFLFQRAVSPGVRRRNNGRARRQSRSVRRHLPSTAPSSTSPSGALSTTAAAVLFTSAQSQASTDSIQDQHFSRRGLPQHRYQSPGPTTAPSSSTGVDSIIAVGTTDRSVPTNGIEINGDSASISTMGYSQPPSNAVSESRPIGSSPSMRTFEAGVLEEPEQSGESRNQNSNANDVDGNNASDEVDREARARWVQINQRFQLMVTVVAILFSLLLFSILISWIVLTSAYVVTFDKSCDVPLKGFYWLVTLQMVLDVFRQDIMRYVLRWDPATQPATSRQVIPARVMIYNMGYLAFALLILRMGINAVYIDGQRDDSYCRHTSPELFQAGFVFVTLTLAAWATVILGYLVPFCFVASLLTLNGYDPGEANVGGLAPGVFPNAYSNNGAPAGCIDQLREVNYEEEQNLPTECCICMEEFGTGRNADDLIIETDCKHVFHRNCCAVWLRQARTCPVCRTDIPEAIEQRAQAQNNNDSEQRQEESHQNGPLQESIDLEQQRQSSQVNPQQTQRPRSGHQTTLSPRLPFVAAGHSEVTTLLRALRRQHRGHRPRQGRRTSRTNDGVGSRGTEQLQQDQSNPELPQQGESSNDDSGHELATMNRTNDASNNTTRGEHRQSSGTSDEEAQFVL